MKKSETAEKIIKKVLIGDLSISKYSVLSDWLKRDNVVVELATESNDILEKISNQHFDVCVVNWLLGGIGPFELLRKLRAESLNPQVKLMVISRQVHKVNIQNAILAGANDFVAEPFENEVLLKRIIYHFGPQKTIDSDSYEMKPLLELSELDLINLSLEISERLSRAERGKEHSVFYESLSKIGDLTGSNRTSLIITDMASESGVVLASSDDPSFHDFPILLRQYPEIQHVVYSGRFVLIPDVTTSTLTQNLSKKVKSIAIGSLMVFPVRFQNEVIGVLMIRRPKASEIPSHDRLRILQAIANNMAAQSNIQVLLRKIYSEGKEALS